MNIKGPQLSHRQLGTKIKASTAFLLVVLGASVGEAQLVVQNITAWTTTTPTNLTDQTVNGIRYENRSSTPATITTPLDLYIVANAGVSADRAFVRRNNATPSGNSNQNGQNISVLSNNSASNRVYGTYNATMEDLLLEGNILNSTWDTFANVNSGAGPGHDIERIDYVWSNGYTVIGDEVVVVFNFDPVNAQDDFRVAVFTSVDGTAEKKPTNYASSGVLVTGTNYPDKLPLPYPSGGPTSSNSSGWSTGTSDDLSGTITGPSDSQTVGIGGVAIKLTDLGVTAGQTIYGYSLIPTDVNASSAANLVDFTNATYYPTNTANADATGTADFAAFGGRFVRPIPEPSTYGLIGLGGLISFAVWRGRKSRR